MLRALLEFIFPHHHSYVHTTVRSAFPLFAITALIAGIASVITQEASYITLTATPTDVQEGQTFYINVEVTAHTPVNAIDITIQYPEGRVRVDGIDTGTSVITLWTKEPYAKNGNVYLVGGTFQKGFLGTHTVARIRATALASGLANVTTNSATFIAGDGKGTEITITDTDSSNARLSILTADGSIIGTASVTIVTDVDGNGTVDLKDISVFMAAWFSRSKTFDFDGDGRMTFRDFSIILYDSFFK